MTNDRKAYKPTAVFNRKLVRGMIRLQAEREGYRDAGKVIHSVYYHEIKKARMKKGVHMYARGSKKLRSCNRELVGHNI